MGEEVRTNDPRIQGALFIWRYACRVGAPAIACYLAERCVPDITATNVAVRLDLKRGLGPSIFLSGRFAEIAGEGSTAGYALGLADVPQLRRWLRQGLEDHLRITVDSLRAYSPIGTHAQWALAADSLAAAFLYAGKTLGCEAEAYQEAAAFTVAPPGSRLRSRASFLTLIDEGRPQTFLRRASCCLLYKLRDYDYCANCPLLAEPERERRLLAGLARLHSNPRGQ